MDDLKICGVTTCLLLLIEMSPTVVRILHVNDIEIYSHHTMISHILKNN
jgi:hypothetical protein